MTREELTAKVKELKNLQALIEEAEAEAETIKDELKAELEAQQTDELTVDVFKIRYKTVTGSRFDSAAFKKSYADLYNLFSKPTVTRRFSVA